MKFIFIFAISLSLWIYNKNFFLKLSVCWEMQWHSNILTSLYTFFLLMKKVFLSIIKKGLKIILWFNLPLFIRYPWMKMKINIRLRVHKKVLLMFYFFFCFGFVVVSNSSSVFACVILCVVIEQRFRVQVVKYVVYSELEKFLLVDKYYKKKE